MAVGLERTHAEFLGESKGLVVVGCGLFNLWRLAPRRNVAEEAQGIRLVAPLLVFTGERQCALGEGMCLLQAASQHLRLPQGETAKRLIVCSFRRSALLHRLCEQWHGVTDAPAQSIRCP